VPGALRAQPRRHRLADPQRAEEVRLQRRAGFGLVELLDHAERHRPGVVDDDVEPAEVLDGGLDRCEHRSAIGDVGAQREHAVEVVDVARERRDAVAALERCLSEGATESAARAGDEPGSGHGGHVTRRTVSYRIAMFVP
jgi:hypothetical protein